MNDQVSDSALSLSFAEVAFVLALETDEAAIRIARLLGVPRLAGDDPLAQAGLAGLMLRGLARREGDDLVLAPTVAAVAEGLLTSTDVASVATALAGGTVIEQLFAGGALALAVRPLPFGCFRFDGLREGTDLADVIVAMVLAPHESRAVAVRVDGCGSFTSTVDTQSATISVDEGPVSAIALDDFEAALRDSVQSLLDRPRSKE